MKHIFIINPKAVGEKQVKHFYDKIEMMCLKNNIEYYIFITEYPKHASEISTSVKEFFEGENIRFYVCGGSGTLFEVINGVRDFAKTEIALYSLGLGNDMLLAFPELKECFLDMEQLISGRIKKIDAIKVNGKLALTSVSLGTEARVSKDRNSAFFSAMGRIKPNWVYPFLAVKNVFGRSVNAYKYETENGVMNCKASSVSIMNSAGHGGVFYPSLGSEMDDGFLSVTFSKSEGIFSYLKNLRAFRSGNFENNKNISVIKKVTQIQIALCNGKFFDFQADGEIDKAQSLEISVCPNLISFVVPK